MGINDPIKDSELVAVNEAVGGIGFLHRGCETRAGRKNPRFSSPQSMPTGPSVAAPLAGYLTC